MHSKPYFTDTDRNRFISEAEAQGDTMLHDEVRDGVWTLVFDTLPLVPPAPPTELDLLYRVLKRRDLTLRELSILARLQQGFQSEA